MSDRPSTRALRPRLATALTGLAILAGLVLPVAASAGPLNTVVLDNGICGRNLQLGSDPTASSSATPTFLLYGDGAAASYRIFIDGALLGTFNTSNPYGNVCITTTVALSQGAHTLTGNELSPHATYTVTPFQFSVDTVPPAVPSAPVLNPSTDSGVIGDNITTYQALSLSGTSEPNAPIRVYAGLAGVGGGRADSTGRWTVTTTTLSIAAHTLTATASDQAGNVSARSAALSLTITSAAAATVPGAPGLTSATPGNASVSLAWSAPASGGSAITGYRVYRSTSPGTQTLLTTLGNVTSWTNTGLTNGTTYYYKVSALNAVGEGGLSNERSATPAAAATVPGAPGLTSATPGNASVSLAWSAPASGGSAITGYGVYRSTSPGTQTLLTTLGNVTSWTNTGLTNGTTYYYKVSALNAVGEGGLSNERSATPAAAATVPGAPGLTSATPGNASVSLAWSAPASGGSAITGYRVYRSTSPGTQTLLTTLGNVTSWTNTGLTNGTTYYYKVSALNAVGEGGLSNERSATPAAAATVPGAPGLTSATPGNASVSLAWSAPASGGSAITGYRVYRSTSPGTQTLLTTLGNVTSWTNTGLTNGTTYYYKVSALNAVGEGGLSNERSATPAAAATVPGAPGLTSATPGNASVSLAWSAPASGGSAITGYGVYRSTSPGTQTLLTTLGNVTSWTNTGLTNGTTYYYKVSALNAVGEGGLSNERSATPAAAATVPGAPGLTSATPGNASVSLAWSAPASGGSAITGYRVYRSTSPGTQTLLTTLGNVTSWTNTGLTNGTTYYYKVSALNAVGEGGLSNERSATPAAAATVPGAPGLTSATPGNASVSLAWSAPASGGSAITGYRVYRSTSPGTQTLLTTLGNVTSWTNTGLTNGTTYYYKVSALNAVGEGGLSNERSATPLVVKTP